MPLIRSGSFIICDIKNLGNFLSNSVSEFKSYDLCWDIVGGALLHKNFCSGNGFYFQR